VRGLCDSGPERTEDHLSKLLAVISR
jgi:hypothetical protein